MRLMSTRRMRLMESEFENEIEFVEHVANAESSLRAVIDVAEI